jgi:thiol:disulfide interchange protein
MEGYAMRRYPLVACAVVLAVWALLAGPSWSQEKTPARSNPFEPAETDAPRVDGAKPRLKLDLGTGPGLGAGIGGLGGGSEEAAFSAGFKVDKASGKGNLYVKVEISPTWHIYSLTQPDGRAQPSKLKVKSSKEYKVGQFVPDVQPDKHFDNAFQEDVEEHTGTVVWTAPLEVAAGVNAEKLTIEIGFLGQVCGGPRGTCIPLSETLTAKFEGYLDPPGAAGEYRPKTANLVWRGHIEPAVVAPGSKAKLSLTATLDKGWHLYAYAPTENPKEVGKPKPTLIVLSNSGDWKKSAVKISKEPKAGNVSGSEPAPQYYEGEVTFTFDLEVPRSAKPGDTILTGFLGFQTCDEKSCLRPSGAKFTVMVPVSAQEQPGKLAISFQEDDYARVAKVAAQQPGRIEPVNIVTLSAQLVLSLIGGVLLNLMPCVLPVLGLKIMSFVKQGGQHRSEVLALNLAYTAGLMIVFLVLATLSAFLNLGWGQQMTQLWFRLTMLVLMFAFGLSFLGVWEMTVPGLGGSEVVEATQGREGLAGAFFKGVFTTILGVSCSGPFLGGVFGYTLTQPWWVTYLIFVCIGLGMASPFLVIGLNPRLISILPKPGEWMNTFKHLMGFVMMGVVIWVFSTLGVKNYIPALTLLVGVSFGLWWIGRVPVYEDTGKQINAWIVGSLAAAAIGWFGFAFLGPVKELYEWKPYYEDALAKYQTEGKTVMVDFTADWCANCQTNFRWAINTQPVKEVVEKNGVVAVKADWTDPNPEIEKKLKELSSRSIPVLAIYPADKPREDVIILRDLVTQKQVLEALKEAGPSRGAASAAPTEEDKSPTGKVAKAGSE